MHYRAYVASVRIGRGFRGPHVASRMFVFWRFAEPKSVHSSLRNFACRGMSDTECKIRQVPAGECPRCGAALPQRGTGRPPKWCSQRCRRAAYEERRAADMGAVAIELVRPLVPVKEHDLSECVSRVAGSPTACRRVLRAMAKLARGGDLLADPKWRPAIDAFSGLADALFRRPARRSQSRFQR
jgi:predicted nucleic acid-binding Zn ribbon protein